MDTLGYFADTAPLLSTLSVDSTGAVYVFRILSADTRGFMAGNGRGARRGGRADHTVGGVC